MRHIPIHDGVAQGNVWNLEVDKAIDLAKAICAAVLFNVIQDDASTTGSFDQAVQKHMSSRDSQLQVTLYALRSGFGDIIILSATLPRCCKGPRIGSQTMTL